ncbi:MAG: recombinase zinc beta ribbon domain-containing protein, partial [Flavobacteriales bacterium]|nr:recombinase zinc beta ribbon domain-containing protein [Flavobacteriales bacterium]
SGTIDDRPEFQRLLVDIIDGEIGSIWAYDDSRIQRNPEIRYLLNNTLRQYKIDYYTHVNGKVDLYNPESELMGGIMAEFNKYFVTITSIKIKSVLRRRALGGKGWGMPPYGYNYDGEGYYQLNDNEKIVVKRIYELSLSGIGTGKIADLLNNEGIATRYNQYDGEIRLNKSKGADKIKKLPKKQVKWSGNTIRGILNNTMFYGTKKIGDFAIEVPKLFELDFWEEVNYNLKNKNKNNNRSGGTKKYKYLLNNVIKCGRCGRNYNGKTRENKKDHFYYCMSKRVKNENCGNRSVNIDKIEFFVWRVLFQDERTFKALVEDIGSVGKLEQYNQELTDANSEYKELQLKKDRVLNLVSEGIMEIEEVRKKISEFRLQITETNGLISNIKQKINNVNSNEIQDLQRSSEYFKKLSFLERKTLVEKFIESVKIHWVENEIDGDTIRYYLIEVIYTINNIVEVYTNHYGLDLDTWLNVKYDKVLDDIYFDYKFVPSTEYFFEESPFRIGNDGDFWTDYTTLVPYGDINFWTTEDLEDHYGKVKYRKFFKELEHKTNSTLIRKILG